VQYSVSKVYQSWVPPTLFSPIGLYGVGLNNI
jgi:hypothetical protein